MGRCEFLRTAALASAAFAVAATGCAARRNEESPPAPPLLPLGDLPQAAVRCFIEEKKSCAESLLIVGCRALGIQDRSIPDAGLGLGGGVGLHGKTCACLTGAAMVLSLAAAAREEDYAARKKRLYKAVGGFAKRFERAFGATDCRTLCGLDLTTPEGLRSFQEKTKAEVCGPIMQKAAQMLAEALPAV